MDAVLQSGILLQELYSNESCCDVVLSCQNGHRLNAHKIILSIASPIFKEIFLDNIGGEQCVVILPDVTITTMKLILNYIYTGKVWITSMINLNEFLITATILQIQIDRDDFEKSTRAHRIKMLRYHHQQQHKSNEYYLSKRNQRKLPNLLPLTNTGFGNGTTSTSTVTNYQYHGKKRRRLLMANHVVPSPWKPRTAPVLSDPRMDYPSPFETLRSNKKVVHSDQSDNDQNNNSFQIQPMKLSNPGLNKELYFNDDKNLKCEDESSNIPCEKVDCSMYSIVPSTEVTSTSSTGTFAPIGRSMYGCDEGDENSDQKNVNLLVDNEHVIEKSSSSSVQIDENLKVSKVENKSKEKPFKCTDCGKTFSQLRNFKYHRSVHEGTKEFAAKCPECGKVFNDRGYLSSHMKIHRDRKEYACSHCPKRFNQRVAYNMHIRIHTGVKPHECTTCGKTFSRKMLLKQHQRVHTGERPYSCPECGKTFADRSNMSLHARLHTGVKPYACTLCPKSFTKKHHLKTHMNFHTGLKPYTCQKCGLAFSQSSNMRTHYKKCLLKPNNNSEKIQTTNR